MERMYNRSIAEMDRRTNAQEQGIINSPAEHAIYAGEPNIQDLLNRTNGGTQPFTETEGSISFGTK